MKNNRSAKRNMGFHPLYNKREKTAKREKLSENDSKKSIAKRIIAQTSPLQRRKMLTWKTFAKRRENIVHKKSNNSLVFNPSLSMLNFLASFKTSRSHPTRVTPSTPPSPSTQTFGFLLGSKCQAPNSNTKAFDVLKHSEHLQLKHIFSLWHKRLIYKDIYYLT